MSIEDENGWTAKSRELGQLLARAGLGDRAAFARLYERTSGHLFAVVLRIQRDRAQAEDLLQEVYVSVWKSAASFDAARSQPLTPPIFMASGMPRSVAPAARHFAISCVPHQFSPIWIGVRAFSRMRA